MNQELTLGEHHSHYIFVWCLPTKTATLGSTWQLAKKYWVFDCVKRLRRIEENGERELLVIICAVISFMSHSMKFNLLIKENEMAWNCKGHYRGRICELAYFFVVLMSPEIQLNWDVFYKWVIRGHNTRAVRLISFIGRLSCPGALSQVNWLYVLPFLPSWVKRKACFRSCSTCKINILHWQG